MNKKGTKALASATLMSLVLTTALATGNVKAAAGSVTQTGGKDRYETAAKVATANFADGSENVILVNGLSYADSVSASALAKTLKAPILLTTADELNADAKDALNTLKPKNVYIVGGEAAVSKSVADSLSDYSVTRLSGANRYATNLAVANELVKNHGVSKDNLLVVTGQAYSDALSAAPVAAAKGEILLLSTNDKTAMGDTYDFAKDSNVTVIGTTNSVDAATYSSLNADKRVDGGANRFETNLNILDTFKDDLKADKLYVATAKPNASGANDTQFADALVASAIAGKYSAPLVLTNSDANDDTATNNAISYIGKTATKTTDLQVVGGTGVVSDKLVDAINKAVNPTTDTDPEVSSITANGLNQIKVVFNQEVDSDTAEDVNNYAIDGTNLNDKGTGTLSGGSLTSSDPNSAKAVLQDDNKTVLITLANHKNQLDDFEVKVKKGILTADKSKTVPEFTQNLTFSDTTAPTLTSVEARGNNKLAIEFSEPVNFGNVAQTVSGSSAYVNAANAPALSKFKINNQNISSFGLDTTGLSKVKDYAVDASGNVWSNKVELYFNSALPTGSNTFKVEDGDATALEDSAAFPVKETTKDFNVDSLATAPKITSVTAEDNGKVYVNFDRAMDAKTAVVNGNYKINGTTLTSTNSKIELKKDDTQVKISNVSSLVNKNSNTIFISKDVKDAFGNKVDDDTNLSFDLTEDETKPTVTSVTALDDSTIRVKFSKDVDVDYATNKSNYKLKDNSGTDISSEILTTGGITVPGGSTDTASVFDISLGSNKLTDSQYTITIKNVQDKASTPNVMDDYTTTFAGSATLAPSVVGTFKVDGDQQKAVVYFNKAMDSSSLSDASNYKFKTGKDEAKSLPSGTTVTPSSDNKSVTIKFPSSYTVTGANDGNDNSVYKIAAIGVKDTNGNGLDISDVNIVAPTPADGTTTVDQKSFKVYYDGDNLKADVKFKNPIDNIDPSDFEFKYGSNSTDVVTPDSAYKNGDKITFQFTDDSKIDNVKSAGQDIKLELASGATNAAHTTDITGSKVAVDSTNGYITPHYYDAAPKTLVDNYDNATTWTAKDGSTAIVTAKFDTPISASSVKTTDFTFNIAGTTVIPNLVTVGNGDGNPSQTVTFKFSSDDSSKFVAGSKIKVTPKTSSQISTPKDENDDYAYYVPSSDDKNGITITIKDITAPSAPDSNKLTVTDNATPAVDTLVGEAGAVEANATVKVYSDAALTTQVGTDVTADSTGAFSAIDLADNNSGTPVTYYVVAVDAAGNTSTVTSIADPAAN